jgi:hypothetical protein
MFNRLTERLETNTPDKVEHFLAKFKDIEPAAKVQANMAIENMDNIGSDAFAFADMEMLDANLVVTPRGNPNADFTPNAWDRTPYLHFTVTVSPQLIIPGAMDFDPSTFLSPTSTTACVRALMQNGGLAQGATKYLLDNTPKLLLVFYRQANTEFDISIKHRSDAAPDQEKCAKWLREIKSRTKFFAAKHHIQQSYVGRLEGTETLAQRLTYPPPPQMFTLPPCDPPVNTTSILNLPPQSTGGCNNIIRHTNTSLLTVHQAANIVLRKRCHRPPPVPKNYYKSLV